MQTLVTLAHAGHPPTSDTATHLVYHLAPWAAAAIVVGLLAVALRFAMTANARRRRDAARSRVTAD